MSEGKKRYREEESEKEWKKEREKERLRDRFFVMCINKKPGKILNFCSM